MKKLSASELSELAREILNETHGGWLTLFDALTSLSTGRFCRDFTLLEKYISVVEAMKLLVSENKIEMFESDFGKKPKTPPIPRDEIFKILETSESWWPTFDGNRQIVFGAAK